VYSWIHGEEWITFTSDTVEGFQLVRELTFLDQPEVVTLLERPRSEGEILLVVATRSATKTVSASLPLGKVSMTQGCTLSSKASKVKS
jgi:hypothetical protein